MQQGVGSLVTMQTRQDSANVEIKEKQKEINLLSQVE